MSSLGQGPRLRAREPATLMRSPMIDQELMKLLSDNEALVKENQRLRELIKQLDKKIRVLEEEEKK
jgi:hypothetical protein